MGIIWPEPAAPDQSSVHWNLSWRVSQIIYLENQIIKSADKDPQDLKAYLSAKNAVLHSPHYKKLVPLLRDYFKLPETAPIKFCSWQPRDINGENYFFTGFTFNGKTQGIGKEYFSTKRLKFEGFY